MGFNLRNRSFLEELESNHRMIIYYDALTTRNTKSPQNALTPLNIPFLKAAGNILLNYRWTPALVQSSLAYAKQHKVDKE